jgi:hypothetical protein
MLRLRVVMLTVVAPFCGLVIRVRHKQKERELRKRTLVETDRLNDVQDNCQCYEISMWTKRDRVQN